MSSKFKAAASGLFQVDIKANTELDRRRLGSIYPAVVFLA
jgi:hypothetical protein